MRALILHSKLPKVVHLAEAFAQELASCGFRVDTVASDTDKTIVSAAGHDLVCVISDFTGILKTQISPAVDALVKKCSRLEGKRSAAVVPAKLGSGRALKTLMAMLERQGMIVGDFAAVSSGRQVTALAKRFSKLVQN